MKNSKFTIKTMRDQMDKNISIVFIGHLAVDRILRFNKTFRPTLGGTVSYGSLALTKYHQKLKVGIITHIGNLNFNQKLLRRLEKSQIDLHGIKWSNTHNTTFILDYLDHNRILTLKSRSPDLLIEDIPKSYSEEPPQIIILGPLCNEISYEYIAHLIDIFPDALIGIDLQGFIRKVDSKGIVSYKYDENLISNMKNIINLIGNRLILKGSEVEMKLVSECEEYHEIINFFRNFNSNSIFIMTLGEQGSWLVKNGEQILKIPAFKPKRVKDETGAGDVYLAIFLLEYLLSDKSWITVEKCAYIASAAASFLVEKKGTDGVQTKEKIMHRVQRKNYIT